jgi:pyrroline-5-carboxylate reductase
MITFIGGGNMASAIAGGLIARGRPARAVEGAAIVVLAVKPQQMREACTALAPHVANVPVVLSIAAGTRTRDIARWLGGYDRIVRAMPDTPSLVGAGIAGVWSAPSVKAADRAAATAILEACGGVVPVAREEALDAVTGVSASGVAYVFYFLEALEAAARAHGFDAKDARTLAYATFDGAVKLALASDEDPATLRARVTSKGGTTERGIAALDKAKVRDAIAAAVDAATKRAAEMGEQLGRDD